MVQSCEKNDRPSSAEVAGSSSQCGAAVRIYRGNRRAGRLREGQERGFLLAAQFYRQPARRLLLVLGETQHDIVAVAPSGNGAQKGPFLAFQQVQRPVPLRLHADEDGTAARVEDRLGRLERSFGPLFVQSVGTGEQDRRGQKK